MKKLTILSILITIYSSAFSQVIDDVSKDEEPKSKIHKELEPFTPIIVICKPKPAVNRHL